jgi:hypothetical protein
MKSAEEIGRVFAASDAPRLSGRTNSISLSEKSVS